MRQLPLAIGPPPRPSLDNFVPGANAVAVQHLRGLQAPAPPVYLWGPAGCGKTHLLRAVAARWAETGLGALWVQPEAPLPEELPAGCSLLLIDSAQALDEAAQRRAFALFVDATTQGVQVLAAGRLPPVDLPLRDDLRTRLGWGPVFALQPLEEAATRAALAGEALRRGFALPEEVLNWMLSRLPRDLGHLMAVLDALDAYTLERGRAATVPLLRELLERQRAEGLALSDGAPH